LHTLSTDILNTLLGSIHGIIFGGILPGLAIKPKRFSPHTGAGIFGCFRAQLDESYRILPLNQNPQNPAPNLSNTKTPTLCIAVK